MPVDREAVNKMAAMKAASTTADPSHHGIDRQRIIRMPMRRPTAAARNFHGRPGDGAGNTRSTERTNEHDHADHRETDAGREDEPRREHTDAAWTVRRCLAGDTRELIPRG